MITSLIRRIYFIVLAVPIGFYLFWIGGWFFTLAIAFVFSLAAYEYCKIFEMGGYQPARWVVVGGTVSLILSRYLTASFITEALLTLLVFCAMAHHLIRYEKGRNPSAADFAVSVGGTLYFGWLGGYFISLRSMDGGLAWFVLVILTVWMVDVGGYCIGRPFGKHFLSPRLSPRKTWEGYAGGILGGVVGALIVVFLWKTFDPLGGPALEYWHAITAGICLGLLTPLGDLGESMVKRQFMVKDSSHIIPGHGGVWDRIDSWLWGIPIGYYLVVLFFL